MFSLPHLIISSGEPAGIGPDLCIMLAQRKLATRITVLGDPKLLQQRAQQLNLPLRLDKSPSESLHEPGSLHILPVKTPQPVRCGQLDSCNAGYVLELIRRATLACLAGHYDALVTCPVHKGIINDAGIAFTGHTEYIAELTGGMPVMLLATPGLRVALATTHLPLQSVSAAITRDSLRAILEILHRDLITRFAIPEPRIIVLGLNPHAGENGYLGDEEITTIQPVLEELRARGLHVQGPLPADTAFLPKYLQQADVVLAMYHDQGLPVLKYKGFGNATNITLGLPIIRTSVDHGTALDLAGTGRIDCSSLITALETAATMCQQQPPNH